jgi:SAM-dependent methyltransferase
VIDVKDLLARYSLNEHVTRADAYFATIRDDALMLRKPFFGFPDTQANMHGLAEVLQRLELFFGARVLDFGAGTGWLSRILALLDCRPIAVDVSHHALALGRRAFERDPLVRGLSVDWRPYDGVTLPVQDASVDRILCYDAFHHVADQVGTLREFYRVLADGGRVVFHEPGPNHSTQPTSQYEMRTYDVIENDIVIEDVWAMASDIGFGNLELALTTPRTLSVPLAQYSRIIAGDATLRDLDAIVASIVEGASNLRIFTMTKGEDTTDSRLTAGLAGMFDVTLTDTTGEFVRGHARVTNTGRTPWRPSTLEVGGVWLGVQRPDHPVQTDFGRIWLSDAPMLPGQTMDVEFSFKAPPDRPVRIAFDLVAENVTWFEMIGGPPLVVTLD